MIISGLNSFSLIDYPGQVACVIFTLGCNMRCSFCHNPDFVLPERIKQIRIELDAEKRFFEFLRKRRGLLDGVSICGGEPTIHRDLPQFCRRIRELGFRVKLDTNGQHPDMLQHLIDNNLVDYIAMDIKHTWEKYPALTGIPGDMLAYQRSVDIIKLHAPDYEFRTTLIGGVHTTLDIDSIGEIVRGAKNYYLQKYRVADVLDPTFTGYAPPDTMLYNWQERLESEYVERVGIRF